MIMKARAQQRTGHSAQSRRGIALGAVLFFVSVLALLITAFTTLSNGYTDTSQMDRIDAEVTSQAREIREKITECYLSTRINPPIGLPADGAFASAWWSFYPP